MAAAGDRVVTHDRRGSGASSQLRDGSDDDTATAALHALPEHLDLRDVALVTDRLAFLDGSTGDLSTAGDRGLVVGELQRLHALHIAEFGSTEGTLDPHHGVRSHRGPRGPRRDRAVRGQRQAPARAGPGQRAGGGRG
ncbi:hypothetical protein SAMN05660642_00176 [Geodermatophilus siccatus]|uniref:Uncharacterized protein n=1 Tax=Geodermatophilus siccatus TaxID=1137991 RepID=A0A1G9KWU0_9ACTN|nr:hypothetical protein [Geodermatophilus siccatus]SDL54198.1 hypothetical protein SAMN05660642_00176 [Geodermatophilus siccatus]